MPQLTFFNLAEETEKENVRGVMKELSSTCRNCRLSLLHPENRGIIWRGNVEGRIGVLGEAPGDQETERGLPMVGPSGKEFEKWMRFIGVDTKKDCFITNVVQCQPGKVLKEGHMQQKAPDKDEIKACFGSRSLRVFKSMPNLEVILTLGWVAAKAVLGGDPKSKTHEGMWWESSLMPGVPVFCLVHPAYALRDPTPEKTGKVEQCLRLFKREYLEKAKDMQAMAALARTTREEKGLN